MHGGWARQEKLALALALASSQLPAPASPLPWPLSTTVPSSLRRARAGPDPPSLNWGLLSGRACVSSAPPGTAPGPPPLRLAVLPGEKPSLPIEVGASPGCPWELPGPPDLGHWPALVDLSSLFGVCLRAVSSGPHPDKGLMVRDNLPDSH